MRVLGSVNSEKEAFVFYSYLVKEGIESTYEPYVDPETKQSKVAIWVYDEDQMEKASSLFEQFTQHPEDPKFASSQQNRVPPKPPSLQEHRKTEEAEKTQERSLRSVLQKPRRPQKAPFTFLVILLCALLYFWNSLQQVDMYKDDGKIALRIGMTPIMQQLMFDYPKANQQVDALLQEYNLKTFEELKNLPPSEKAKIQAAENIPTWRGILALLMSKIKKDVPPPQKAPLFEKIREGQFWRLFTPCLLHAGFLHILFNMAWAWVLLKQLEARLPIWKIVFVILIIGIVSNVAQYFVSGPYFLGFSGVVCGLVGFIWMRQKIAPWEGYPLQKMTIIFIVVFVLAMFALELFSLALKAFSPYEATPQIANTAHIIGGITGILVARISLFGRGIS